VVLHPLEFAMVAVLAWQLSTMSRLPGDALPATDFVIHF